MTRWYYKESDNSKENGPITAKQLLNLIHQQKVLDKTLIRKDDSQWVQACKVNGLWDAAKRPTVAFTCPHCGKPIDQPPSRCRRCEIMIDKAQGKLVHHDLSKPPKRIVKVRTAKPVSEHQEPTADISNQPPSNAESQKSRSWLRWWPPK